MENFGDAENAQDLFEFLSKIPEQIRKKLPITLMVDDTDFTGKISLEAVDIISEGNRETLFRMSNPDSDEEEG